MKRLCTELAAVAKVTIPEMTEELKKHVETEEKRKEIFDWFANHAYATLAANVEAQNYLHGRGFDLDFCKRYEVGYIDQISQLEVSNDALDLVGLASRGNDGVLRRHSNWSNRVVGLIRDKRGRSVGFWGRALGRAEAKYLNTGGDGLLDEIGAYCIQHVSDRAIVSEGPLDALTWQLVGEPGISILGSINKLSTIHLARLYQLGVRYLTIADDNDDQPGKRAKRQLAVLDAVAKGGDETPRVYFANELRFEGAKDANGLYTAMGANALRVVASDVERGAERRASLYATGLDLKTTFGLDRYRDLCAAYVAITRLDSVELSFFANRVAAISTLTAEDLRKHYDVLQKRQRETDLSNVVLEAATKRDWKGITKALYMSREITLADMQRPVRRAIDEMSDVANFLQKYHGKSLIGLNQPTLPRLCAALSGWRGVTLLASRTGVGKTIFVCQQVLDVLKANSDVCAILCSFEMPFEQIMSRMWSHLAGVEWQDLAFRGTGLELGMKRFKDYANRMIILDKKNMRTTSQDEIIAAAETLKQLTGCNHVNLIIDYVDIYEPPQDLESRLRTETQEQKWQMQEMLDIRDRLGGGDPVIAITEVRKGTGQDSINNPITPDDVMGSSRKAYAADALLIYNPLTAIDLYELYELTGGGIMRRARREEVDLSDKKVKRKQIIQTGDEIRRFMNNLSIDLGIMDVVKTRDAGRRDRIELTNYFRQSRFIEGHTCEPAPEIPTDPLELYDETDECDF